MSITTKNPCVILESARGYETLHLKDKLLSDSREIFLTEEVTAGSCASSAAAATACPCTAG